MKKVICVLIGVIFLSSLSLGYTIVKGIIPFEGFGAKKSFSFRYGRTVNHSSGDVTVETMRYIGRKGEKRDLSFTGWVLAVLPDSKIGVEPGFVRGENIGIIHGRDYKVDKNGIIWMGKWLPHGYIKSSVGIFVKNRLAFKGLEFYVQDRHKRIWRAKVVRVFHDSLEIKYMRIK